MKNAILIAGVLISAVVIAVGAWAVFGGSGSGRRAVLQEPTTTGFVGRLTMSGVQGVVEQRVGSFNWHATTSCTPTCSVVPGSIEVLRELDPISPNLFAAGVQHTNSPSATLDIIDPVTESTYQTWNLTNARLAEFRAGKREKLALTYSALSASTSGGPDPDRAQKMGQVTFPSQRPVPIYGFDLGYQYPYNHVVFDQATIKRPPDRQTETLVNRFQQQTSMSNVVIELQDREGVTHTTITLDTAVVADITESAAAGIAPTEELKLTFRKVTVAAGESSFCWDVRGNSNAC